MNDHIDNKCERECKHRIVAAGYMAPNSTAINIYAQSGQITIELINGFDHEIGLAQQELSQVTTSNDRQRELSAMVRELHAMRRHVIRIDADAALGKPRRGYFLELCATENCPNTSRWMAHDEVMKLGSKAPYRCAECCDRRAADYPMDNKQMVLFSV